MSIFTALFVFMGIYINEFNSYLYCAIGIISGWAVVFISKQNLEIRSENDALKFANVSLIQQQQKALDEIKVLRQKHSRANQPRSGGKFTPVIVKAGDKYMCKKDVDMGAYIAFTSGQLYISQHDRCITNNNNTEWHTIGSAFCKKHFKLINQ